MNVARHLRVSFLAVLTLCLVVALSACSKKDVIEDEPGFSTSEDAGMAMGGEEMGAEGMGGEMAGDMGTPAAQMQTVYFAFDSYSLDSLARDALKANADWLAANPNATVQIEGHCDERGTTEYNLALGERRANSVVNYMAQVGVDASRLSVISYGEERPVDPGTGEEAWSRNRRAEFVILSQ